MALIDLNWPIFSNSAMPFPFFSGDSPDPDPPEADRGHGDLGERGGVALQVPAVVLPGRRGQGGHHQGGGKDEGESKEAHLGSGRMLGEWNQDMQEKPGSVRTLTGRKKQLPSVTRLAFSEW